MKGGIMDRLLALRAVIDAVLALPDDLRAELARWVVAENPKPNGHDPHPSPIATLPHSPSSPSPSHSKRSRKPMAARAVERSLLEALRDNPNLGERALANSAGVSRSSAGERLRRLAAEGKVAKGVGGHWRLAEEKARLPTQGEQPGPPQPSPN
jgi:hypothetical protein